MVTVFLDFVNRRVTEDAKVAQSSSPAERRSHSSQQEAEPYRENLATKPRICFTEESESKLVSFEELKVG